MNVTTTRRPKQTAGNNSTLAHIRAWMNDPVYRAACEAMNSGGEDAARAAIGRAVRDITTILTTWPDTPTGRRLARRFAAKGGER